MNFLTKLIEKFEEDMIKRGFKIQQSCPEKDRNSVDVISLVLEDVFSTIQFTRKYGVKKGIYVEAPGELGKGVISLRAMGEGLRLIHETDYWLVQNGTLIESKPGKAVNTEDGVEQHNNIWRKYKIDGKKNKNL